MSFFILFRHLFAPAYTETRYTPSGDTLKPLPWKSEVSSDQHISPRQLPVTTPPLGSQGEQLSEDNASAEGTVFPD